MQYVKVALVIAAILIAGASLVVSNILVRDLTKEEEKSMEVWAAAMRSLQTADETTDLQLVLEVIEGNTTIPVIVVDENDHILAARNIGIPQDSLAVLLSDPNAPQTSKAAIKLQKRAARMKASGEHLRLELDAPAPADSLAALDAAAVAPPTIDIHYENSVMLRRLAQYPYWQLGIVALFIAVAILALLSSKRAEQNKVWVGLSRETAHQLGTPLSSLMAGSEILKESYPDDPLLPEMDKDIRRLQLIADRFSKIGATPKLTPENLCDIVRSVAEYIRHRASDKVSLTTSLPSDNIPVLANAPLFEWVIENLCKNAIDAMAGQGSITIYVYTRGDRVAVEVSDTGKGIPRKNFKTVFKPGFTTKKRGWGLGLSLAKRIVEEYHGGRIFVKDSEPGKGTTFCILLRKP